MRATLQQCPHGVLLRRSVLMRTRTAAPILLLVVALSLGCGEQPTGLSGAVGGPSFQTALAFDDGVLAGQLLAFGSDRAGFFNIFVMQQNGMKQTQLTNVPGYNARPNWSHDGRRITFTTCR